MDENIQPADCIFCQIVRGDAPAHRVYEDDQILVFMDIFPVAEGHALVIPKAHCSNLLDAAEDDLREVIAHSKRIAHAIRVALVTDGIGVFQLNGAAAGQTVFHYHMHLIPRHKGDPLMIHSRTPGKPERLAEIAGQIAAALAGTD